MANPSSDICSTKTCAFFSDQPAAIIAILSKQPCPRIAIYFVSEQRHNDYLQRLCLQKGHSNPVIKIEDFQIVNGAQTSHSLLEAYNRSPDAFENIVIMVRVYATARGDIAERVAVATNSQARIQARDLRANHPILKKLEIAFLNQGYYFERKRNMHADKDPGAVSMP
ncbi:AIPR family protein [Brucella pituitosa]|uniref:AIPR family protein n=1 Tax=Brucella pituitosa TaxID=571256 RepID=UPI00209329CE|nr:AIPR family protein [Brucella pituitosa]